MNPNDAAQTYRESAIETAPPVKIVRLLYEGAIRFLDRACNCDAADPRSRFVHWLMRADAIVAELRISLEHDEAADVSKNLEQLYLFCERRIGDSMRERTVTGAEEARGVLHTLLSAWQHVEIIEPQEG